MRIRIRLPLHVLALVVTVALSAAFAVALDCTPLDTFLCSGNACYNYIGIDAVPGEFACGTDYTGWDFQVFDVELTAPGLASPASYTSGFDPLIPDNHLLLFEHCDLAQCIASDTSSDWMHGFSACLDTGTYTLIIASNTTAQAPIGVGMNAGCVDCDPVAGETQRWGAVKSLCR
ncbi:hypothetical protein KKG45_02995 [bacterium]|nr:hypothetical protein [bacterium]MBU1072191.1 hypothetical protein [bacterium]MBU1676441.1 hypothetical protein [bacterium]